MRTAPLIAFASVLATACSIPTENASPESETLSEPEVVLTSEVTWEQLNPARGDQSPKAGTLWGDRKGTVATGYLIQFEDGFVSPPHIHNVSYRGVVIRGRVHNDDPDAARGQIGRQGMGHPLAVAAAVACADDSDIGPRKVNLAQYINKGRRRMDLRQPFGVIGFAEKEQTAAVSLDGPHLQTGPLP